MSIYEPDQVTSGYWFTAFYGDLHTRLPSSVFRPGQVGPHIYDNNGDLIWSGAHLFGDRTTFDFKVAQHNGSQFLTFIAGSDLNQSDYPGGSGVVLDNSYNYVQTVDESSGRGTMNMHEFTTIDDGRRALMITYGSRLTDVVKHNVPSKTFVGNNGFSEVETATGNSVFSWWALDHIDPAESRVPHPSGRLSYESPWDFFHLNSIDKNSDGDYLISARYTNAIYKISGKDGSIVWRFGGSKSDFELDGFTFSSQHDARWKHENESTTVITFFNNHSDGTRWSGNVSSAMEVALDTTTMKATLINEWKRPDEQLTHLRGNAQQLANDHMFVCWSENSYTSEFSADGTLVMEAQMASHRLVSYRTYKFNFTAIPSEPIAVKAFVYGVTPETSTTVYYVSWNGATEVAEWKFYTVERDQPVHIGTARRTGFETMFMSDGMARTVLVEAVDRNGNSLGKSEIILAQLPPIWDVEATQVNSSSASDHEQNHEDIETINNTVNLPSNPSQHNAEDSHESPKSMWTLIEPQQTFTVITSCAVTAAFMVLLTFVALRRLRRSRNAVPAWAKQDVA